MPWFGGWSSPWWGWGCCFYPWLPRRWWAYGASWPLWPYAAPWTYVPPTVPPEAELSALRAHAQWLKGQLDAIEGRIKELEKEG